MNQKLAARPVVILLTVFDSMFGVHLIIWREVWGVNIHLTAGWLLRRTRLHQFLMRRNLNSTRCFGVSLFNGLWNDVCWTEQSSHVFQVLFLNFCRTFNLKLVDLIAKVNFLDYNLVSSFCLYKRLDQLLLYRLHMFRLARLVNKYHTWLPLD